MPIHGAHVSAAGGLYNCFANVQSIGATAMQIFVSSPRTWQVNTPGTEVVAQFKKIQKETKLGPVFAHAAYLVNLASQDAKIRHTGITSLSGHLAICETLGIAGLIFHLGSVAKGGTRDEGIALTAKAMNDVLAKVPGKSFLIMENSSGGGGKLGASMEEMGAMFRLAKNPRVKVCLDTAHAFEAGELKDFSTSELDAFVKRCDKAFGWKNVVCIHFNDSKTEHGSNHDRHENLGEGHIGLKRLQTFARHPAVAALPLITEVPGFDGEGSDKKNMAILKRMLV